MKLVYRPKPHVRTLGELNDIVVEAQAAGANRNSEVTIHVSMKGKVRELTIETGSRTNRIDTNTSGPVVKDLHQY